MHQHPVLRYVSGEGPDWRITLPEHVNFAVDVMEHWAQDRTKLAMVWVDEEGREERLTYHDFVERSNQAAQFLTGLGIGRGDKIFMQIPRVVAWWELMLGAFKIGAVPMPGTTLLMPKDQAYRINLAGASVIIVDEVAAERFDQVSSVCPSVKHQIIVGSERPGWLRYEEHARNQPTTFTPTKTIATDPFLVYFTSGTTGNPKMVLHTHSYPYGHIRTGKEWTGLAAGDLHWAISDTGWAKAAWGAFFGPWSCGSAIFVEHSQGKFNAVRCLELLDRYQITGFCAPPTVYRLLVLEDLKKYDLSHLRNAVGAGEPLNPEVIEVFHQGTGLSIRDGYGQTETVCVVGNMPGMAIRPGSMGKPLPGFIVDVVDDAGTILAAAFEGNIAIKVRPYMPVGMFEGYHLDPEATASRMVGDWYLTGDRAYRDDDDFLWFVGRADDVIISAGYRIGPFEVESALAEHHAVLESAVVSSPHPTRGEVVKAFVILKPGFAANPSLVIELQDHVKSVTAPYKYPRAIEFVTELPKTVSGKIRRIELREREWQREGQ